MGCHLIEQHVGGLGLVHHGEYGRLQVIGADELAGMGREHQDLGLGHHRQKVFRHRQAGAIGQMEIEDQQLGMVTIDRRIRLRHAGTDRHDFEGAGAAQEAAHQLGEHRMVLGDQTAHGHGRCIEGMNGRRRVQTVKGL
jgi:hypothetical protein